MLRASPTFSLFAMNYVAVIRRSNKEWDDLFNIAIFVGRGACKTPHYCCQLGPAPEIGRQISQHRCNLQFIVISLHSVQLINETRPSAGTGGKLNKSLLISVSDDTCRQEDQLCVTPLVTCTGTEEMRQVSLGCYYCQPGREGRKSDYAIITTVMTVISSDRSLIENN